MLPNIVENCLHVCSLRYGASFAGLPGDHADVVAALLLRLPLDEAQRGVAVAGAPLYPLLRALAQRSWPIRNEDPARLDVHQSQLTSKLML